MCVNVLPSRWIYCSIGLAGTVLTTPRLSGVLSRLFCAALQVVHDSLSRIGDVLSTKLRASGFQREILLGHL